jgi:hypothetical protein
MRATGRKCGTGHTQGEGLYCDFMAERDAAILRSIKSLEQINGSPAEEFSK